MDDLFCPECGKLLEYGGSDIAICDGCKQPVKKEYALKRGGSDIALDVHDLDWERLSEKFEETPEGYLKGRACVTTVGVYPYLDGGKIRYELRPREEVMDWDSLTSLKLKPLINGHVKEGVSVDNFKDLSIGITGSEIYTDQDRVYIDILVTDADAIAEIKAGKRALSCGYQRKLVDKSGVTNGSRYDKIQTHIRYDHVALVDRGRAGDDAVLRLDGIVFNQDSANTQNTSQEKNMKKILIGDAEIEVPDSVADHFEKSQMALDEANAKIKAEGDKFSKLQASFDSAQEELVAVKKEKGELKVALDAAPAKFEEKLKAHLALAGKIKVAGVELTGDEDELAMKVKAIKAVSPEANLDGKDSAYIDARFDHAMETLGKNKAQDDQNSKELNGDGAADSSQKPAKKLTSDEAHDAYVHSLEQAHLENKD